MRSTKLFALSLLFVSTATMALAASSVPGEPAVPAGARLEQYPLEPGVLNVTQETKYNLRPTKLTTPWTGYNHYRGLRGGRWVLETLPVGTIVLVDGSGDPVYKADCGNRLVSIAKCPLCLAAPISLGTGIGNGGSVNRMTRSNFSDPGFWGRHPLLAKFLDFLAALFLWLLGLLVLALLLYLLWRLIELALRPYRREPYVPPAVAPASAPAAPLVMAPAPALAPDVPLAAAAPEVPVAAAPVAPETPYVAFYHGGEGGEHKVNFAGHRQVRVTDHRDGRFTMHFKR